MRQLLSSHQGQTVLRSARAVEDVTVNCGLLKKLSGGDSIVTRELYGLIMQSTPQFKMVLTCNRLPEIPLQDGQTWRRIRVVEFQSIFCEPEPNNTWSSRLTTPSALGWMSSAQLCYQPVFTITKSIRS